MKKILLFCLFAMVSASLLAQRSENEQLAIQYYQNGEYEKAADLFEDLFDKKQDSYIYYYYYQTLMSLSDYKKLEKVVKKQQKKQPGTQRYKIDLGYVYERSGELDKAEKVYLDAIKELEPNESKVKELQNAFWSKGLRDYAIASLQKGRKILNNDKLFASELASIYMQLQQNEKVIEEALHLLSNNDLTYITTAEGILQSFLLDDADQMKYLSLKTQLQKQTQKYPDNIGYVTLLYWILQIHKDYESALILAKSLDKRNKEEGDRLYDLARLASKNKDYATAIEALQYVLAKGEKSSYYEKAKYELLDVQYLQLTSVYPIDLPAAQALEKEIREVLNANGIHSATADLTRKYAYLTAFCTDQPDTAVATLEKAIANATRDKKEHAQYKIDLADIQLYMNNIWDATLNYSQVEKDFPNDTIGQTAKFKNAKLSFYIGEFEWAKSQLDVLRAATSKLIANDAMYFSLLISDNEEDTEDEEEANALATNDDNVKDLFSYKDENLPLQYYAKADFLLFRNKDKEALQMLDSVLILAPFGKLADDVWYQKAKIHIRQKDYFAAEKELQKITTGYAYDLLGDDAWYSLAQLYEYYLKDTQKAMDAYQKLMKEYPGSIYVVDARKQYRTLRGDF